MHLFLLFCIGNILMDMSKAEPYSRSDAQYYRTPSRNSHYKYQTPRNSGRHSAATSSFDWSETVGRSGMSTYGATRRSIGSSLSSTFDEWSQSVSSFLSGPRVHQMRSRCTPADIPQPSYSGDSDTHTILYTIVSRAMECDPQHGSTGTFKACLAMKFPDLAPSAACYDCINEFVDRFKPHCPSKSHSCIEGTTKNLWGVCSP